MVTRCEKVTPSMRCNVIDEMPSSGAPLALDAVAGAAAGAATFSVLKAAVAAAAVAAATGSRVEPPQASGLVAGDGRTERRPAGVEAAEAAALGARSGARLGTGSVYLVRVSVRVGVRVRVSVTVRVRVRG